MQTQRYILLCLLFGWNCQAPAAESIIAIKANRIDTVASGVVENGVLLIRGGKISAIGANIEIPHTANVIDARDKTLFPGLVNPVSGIGLSASPRAKATSTPHYRVLDELYPLQDVYRRVQQAGFTTVGLLPSGRGISGQGAIVRLTGQTPEEMLVTKSGPLMIHFEAEEQSKKVLRNALESAQKQTDSTDPKVKPLTEALQGGIPVFIRCDTPGETVHLLPLLKSYEKMKWVLVAGLENYRIAETLAKANIPVILQARIHHEAGTLNRINVHRILAEAGVKIACIPIGNVEGSEDFLHAMALLVRYGLDEDTAKKAMTLHPAQMLGVDYRLGSLEVGKDANLLILTADPFDAGAKIHQILLEGKSVYQAP
jgi:imidazolonepropionase-like amidohydrolase